MGGIVEWLCQTTAAPHPAPDLGQFPGQGIEAGEEGVFAELVRANRAGATYANVHSSLFGPGEIRGQIGHGGHGERD